MCLVKTFYTKQYYKIMQNMASKQERYYPKWAIKPQKKKKDNPPIPVYAENGVNRYPLPTRFMLFGVFMGAVALLTPYWAWMNLGHRSVATVGLWSICIRDRCSSIRDSFVPYGSVPAWYHMMQGTFCIGLAGSLIVLGILCHSTDGTRLQMTLVVHRTVLCLLGITVLQQFSSLYIFLTYFEDVGFLCDMSDVRLIEVYGSFYAALISVACGVATAFSVWLDGKITRRPRQVHTRLNGKLQRPGMVHFPPNTINGNAAMGKDFMSDPTSSTGNFSGSHLRKRQPGHVDVDSLLGSASGNHVDLEKARLYIEWMYANGYELVRNDDNAEGSSVSEEAATTSGPVQETLVVTDRYPTKNLWSVDNASQLRENAQAASTYDKSCCERHFTNTWSAAPVNAGKVICSQPASSQRSLGENARQHKTARPSDSVTTSKGNFSSHDNKTRNRNGILHEHTD